MIVSIYYYILPSVGGGGFKICSFSKT